MVTQPSDRMTEFQREYMKLRAKKAHLLAGNKLSLAERFALIEEMEAEAGANVAKARAAQQQA